MESVVPVGCRYSPERMGLVFGLEYGGRFVYACISLTFCLQRLWVRPDSYRYRLGRSMNSLMANTAGPNSPHQGDAMKREDDVLL